MKEHFGKINFSADDWSVMLVHMGNPDVSLVLNKSEAIAIAERIFDMYVERGTIWRGEN